MSEQQSVFEILDQSELERGPRVKALYELGFTWADLEDEEYWLDAIALMHRDTYKELEEASSKLWAILDKAVRYVHLKRDLYELLGIPLYFGRCLTGVLCQKKDSLVGMPDLTLP